MARKEAILNLRQDVRMRILGLSGPAWGSGFTAEMAVTGSAVTGNRLMSVLRQGYTHAGML